MDHSPPINLVLTGLDQWYTRHPYQAWRRLKAGGPSLPAPLCVGIDPLQRLLDLATGRGALSRLRSRAAQVRTSFYADDAAIFIAPIKQDLDTIAFILHNFGQSQDSSQTSTRALWPTSNGTL